MKREKSADLEFSSMAMNGKKKREKSLGQLCLQFIELFVSVSSEMSLEQAGQMLSSPSSSEYDKIKTKVRRLYDIANVLQALNLIKKILLPNHKAGFQWLGYNGFLSFLELQQKKVNQNLFFKTLAKENRRPKTQKIFVVSHEPLTPIKEEIPQTTLGVKRFKPKVLQTASPFFNKGNTGLDVVSVGRNLKFEANENCFNNEKFGVGNSLTLLLKAVEKK